MIPVLTGLQQVTYYTFVIAFFAMAASALFFLLQRNEVAPGYRTAVTLGGIVLAIAAGNYFYMKDLYIVGVASGATQFPTHFRYIDWLLTVPLLLAKLPALLGMGPRGKRFLLQLVVLAALMIITAFIGEVNPANQKLHFGLFAFSCVTWLAIVGLILFSLTDLPPDIDSIKRNVIKKFGLFVLVGWLIYPLGYIMPSVGLEPEVRELIYNVGDVFNKAGMAMVVFAAGMATRRNEEDSEVEQPMELESTDYAAPLNARV